MNNEQLQNHLVSGEIAETPYFGKIRAVSKRIVCADGVSLSVQANYGSYSHPRTVDGPYFEVEVGYPSEKIDELMPYAEDSERPTDTVYAYVPIDVVLNVINAHGGSPELEMAE